jgi:hypothetical protein
MRAEPATLPARCPSRHAGSLARIARDGVAVFAGTVGSQEALGREIMQVERDCHEYRAVRPPR